MRIGVPRERKVREYRVGLTPHGARELVARGHTVLVESGAGEGSGYHAEAYVAAGAVIVPDPCRVWGEADLVVKVKEPIAEEYSLLRPGLILFTYLHLAADKAGTDALLAAGTTAIAYETVQRADGTLPLLTPMSEVAGRMATQVGATLLQRSAGGVGCLVGGVPGAPSARVLVIGAGVAGLNATAMAVGMEADVAVLDINMDKLRLARERFGSRVQVVPSTLGNIEEQCLSADLVIGAVLVPGAPAPKVVSSELVHSMRPGSVLVDIAIDQGGCFADSRPTTHDEPTYRAGNSTFYCVANMPGAYPHTSTRALTNHTLPYVASIADAGWVDACRADAALAKGLNTHAGELFCAEVAAAHGHSARSVHALLA